MVLPAAEYEPFAQSTHGVLAELSLSALPPGQDVQRVLF